MRVKERLAACLRGLIGRRRRGDDGVTVMEIVVAMTIIGGVMASASLFFIGGLRNTGGQSQRQTATSVASQKLESIQTISPASLIVGRDCNGIYTFTHTTAASTIVAQDQIAATSSGQTTAGNCDTTSPLPPAAVPYTGETAVVNGVTYNLETYIDVCWLVGSKTTGNCGPTNTGGTLTKMFRVSVDVWYVPTSGLACSGLVAGRCDYVATTLIDPSNDPTFNSNILVPTVTAMNPSNVLVGTTQSVTLTGTNFVNGISVVIAATGGKVLAVTNNTGTSLTFTLQAGSSGGTSTITMLNPDGGTTTTSIVENPYPNISSISPATVTPNTTTTLTLNGTGFQSGATVSVSGGGTISNATWVSSTKMTVSYTSNGTAGSRTFTVTNPDTGSDTATLTVKSAPTITSISPSGVGASSTNTLTVTGTGFVAGATISVSSGTVSNATVVNSTTATVTLTSGSSTGSKSLTLTNPDGGAASSTFTVNGAPTISSITTLACSATTQTLTITGTGLVTGASVSDTAGDTFGSVVANGANTSATVSGVIRNGAVGSARTLTFTNPDGGSVTKSLAVTNCSTPSISTVTPGSGSINAPLTITLSGSGFLQGLTVTSKKGTTSFGTVSNVVVNSAGTSVTFTWTASNQSSSASYTFTVTQDGGDTASKSVTYSKIT